MHVDQATEQKIADVWTRHFAGILICAVDHMNKCRLSGYTSECFFTGLRECSYAEMKEELKTSQTVRLVDNWASFRGYDVYISFLKVMADC